MAAMIGLPRPSAGRLRIDPERTTIDMVFDLDSGRYIPRRIHYDYSPESPPVVVFAMPTLVQCKKIFWKPLLNLLTDHPTVASINKSECTIKFIQPKDNRYYRPDVICLGLNDQDGDRARGLRIGHINMKPGIFDEVVVPALSDTPGSTALITLTPKGKINHGYEFFKREQQYEDWQSFHFITTDNPTLPPEALKAIERARKVLPPRIYRQEHEASFEDFPGQIFDHLDDNHLTNTLPTVFNRCILGVDWGDVNPALVAVGVEGHADSDRYTVLDTWYSDTGANILDETLIGEAEKLVKRHGIRQIYCGHDRPASIEKWNKHFHGVKVEQAFTPVSEGNNAINGLLYHKRLQLAGHLTKFKDKLAAYHRRQNKNGKFLDEPATGQDDHEVDALRYAVASDVYLGSSGTQHAPIPTPEEHSATNIRNIFGAGNGGKMSF